MLRRRDVAPARPRARSAPRSPVTAGLASLAGNRAFSGLVAQERQRPPLVVARFGSEEHRSLGAEASGDATLGIVLDDGSQLAYGEMVALAGDLFESMEQVRGLLTSDAGKRQIRYARFWKLGIGSESGIDEPTKKAVKDRYYELAARNISHFSAGGTAAEHYTQTHVEALWLAFEGAALCSEAKDRDAMATEAFSNHYLSDMFSGGHVRTPRQEMKEWYTETYPDSVERFVSYMADRVTSYIDSYGEPSWFHIGGYGVGPRNWIVKIVVAGMIRDLGGSALQSFSLGDLVSLAYHNQDNKGINVVSDVDEKGQPVPGGYHWEAKGDGHLDESPQTRSMTVAAMKASLVELNDARRAGTVAARQIVGVPPSAFGERLGPMFQAFREQQGALQALRYVPREDPDRPNPNMNWHWGQLDPLLRASLDDAVRSEVIPALREKAGGIGDADGVVRKAGMEIHARRAVLQFCDQDLSRGTVAIEEAMEAQASGLPEPSDAGVDQPSGGVLDAGGPPSDTPDAGLVPAGAGAAE